MDKRGAAKQLAVVRRDRVGGWRRWVAVMPWPPARLTVSGLISRRTRASAPERMIRAGVKPGTGGAGSERFADAPGLSIRLRRPHSRRISARVAGRCGRRGRFVARCRVLVPGRVFGSVVATTMRRARLRSGAGGRVGSGRRTHLAAAGVIAAPASGRIAVGDRVVIPRCLGQEPLSRCSSAGSGGTVGPGFRARCQASEARRYRPDRLLPRRDPLIFPARVERILT